MGSSTTLIEGRYAMLDFCPVFLLAAADIAAGDAARCAEFDALAENGDTNEKSIPCSRICETSFLTTG